MLNQQLRKDLIVAMKEKDSVKKGVLQVVIAALNKQVKENNAELTDEKVMEILSKEVKIIRQGLEDLKKGNREEAVNKAVREIEILEAYLPKQLTENEVEQIVRVTVAELGISHGDSKMKGTLIKTVMTKVKGAADGKLVSSVVNRILQ